MTKHIHVHLHRAKAADAGNWEESKHKRNHGQFSSTGGSGKANMQGPRGQGPKPTKLKAGERAGDRITAQQHKDKSMMHATQANMHKPSGK